MKKIFCFLISAIMMISFASCKSSEKTSGKVDTSKAQEIDTSMPEPFENLKNDTGGDQDWSYYREYKIKYENLPGSLLDLADSDKVNKWISQFEDGSKSREESNVLSFLKEFNISKEQALAWAKNNSGPESLTEQDIEILYSNDKELIDKNFVSEYAILSNDKIYTPEWIYTHTIQAYEAEEIPPELIKEKMELYKDIPFSSKALDALEKKLNSYLYSCNNQVKSGESSEANNVEETATYVQEQMPPPFEKISDDSGGDERMPYYSPANFLLTAIPYELILIAGVDNFEQWKETVENSDNDRDDIENSVNLYSFCKHFNITDDQLTSFVTKQIEIDKSGEVSVINSWSKNDLAILLTHDETAIRQHFISEYAILSNDKIYTPEWIYTHTIQAYEAEEIPPELIEEKMELYKDIPFSPKALDALEKKLNSYIKMDLSFDKATKETVSETSASETTSETNLETSVSE